MLSSRTLELGRVGRTRLRQAKWTASRHNGSCDFRAFKDVVLIAFEFVGELYGDNFRQVVIVIAAVLSERA